VTGTTAPSPTSSSSVAQAEAAWLDAVNANDPAAMRRLMHPQCLVVHAAVGHIHGVDDFLRHTARIGRFSQARVHDVTVRLFHGVAVVTCLQEFHVAQVADALPFVTQAAVTRVWVQAGAGWKLAHMQLARRQPPG
jgi:ketosteroid isomerase-like protein